MATADDLRRLLQDRDKLVDGLSSEFRSRFAKVVEQAIERIAKAEADQVDTIEEVREILADAGFDDLVVDILGEALEGLPESFTSANPTLLDEAVKLTAEDLERFGTDASRNLLQVIRRTVLAGDTFEASMAALERAGTPPARSESLANTALLDFYQSATNIAAEESGADGWIYLGPDDRITRPFCDVLINEYWFTREQIDKLDNRQIGNAYISRGGWNCRHSWLPIFGDQKSEFKPATDEIIARANEAAAERRSPPKWV